MGLSFGTQIQHFVTKFYMKRLDLGLTTITFSNRNSKQEEKISVHSDETDNKLDDRNGNYVAAVVWNN